MYHYKDRLYTFAPRHRSRRSTQTVIFQMADGLARLIAPILPVTADELWKVLPGERDVSVHLADFPAGLDAGFPPIWGGAFLRRGPVWGRVLPGL